MGPLPSSSLVVQAECPPSSHLPADALLWRVQFLHSFSKRQLCAQHSTENHPVLLRENVFSAKILCGFWKKQFCIFLLFFFPLLLFASFFPIIKGLYYFKNLANRKKRRGAHGCTARRRPRGVPTSLWCGCGARCRLFRRYWLGPSSCQATSQVLEQSGQNTAQIPAFMKLTMMSS